MLCYVMYNVWCDVLLNEDGDEDEAIVGYH